ncbi:hypothetical protein EYC80_005233 [Monilinia laxa]|uniref:Uncharacterized protein n=1 Tax=Monilinia laxa TaxID=61186 RepID=A0A5N6KJ96_MONLA|nr:hypothetical protein EYC80_005233 [Monilinia laxa]
MASWSIKVVFYLADEFERTSELCLPVIFPAMERLILFFHYLRTSPRFISQLQLYLYFALMIVTPPTP